MKYLFSILLLFGFVAANAQATYPMRRTNGNAIVTDVALTATEYFRLPTFNALTPNLGTYADSSGRILFNLFDSNLLVRNNGTYLFYQPSTKTVNLAGAQTIFGNKIFTGSATFSGTNTFTTLATFNSNISAGGEINPAVDIKWPNNTGFGLKGSDNVRYLSYTTAGGVVVGLSAARVDIHHGATLALRTTTSGGISVTNSGLFGSGVTGQRGNFTSLVVNKDSIPRTTSNTFGLTIDTTTNRVQRIVLPSGGTYTPTITSVANLGSTTAQVCYYTRVGDIVTVSGFVQTQTVSDEVVTTLDISLPIASNFTSAVQLSGSSSYFTSSFGSHQGLIKADATNDRATVSWLPMNGAGEGDILLQFTFTYRII